MQVSAKQDLSSQSHDRAAPSLWTRVWTLCHGVEHSIAALDAPSLVLVYFKLHPLFLHRRLWLN